MLKPWQGQNEGSAGLHQSPMRLKRTPHLPSSVGHPLPQGERAEILITRPDLPSPMSGVRWTPSKSRYRTSLGHALPWERAVVFPLPWGEGGPRPALSPAGAGRMRGLFVGDAYMALEVCDTRDFDETLEGSGSGCCCSGDLTSPSNGVKPPLQQTDPPPERAWNWKGISYPPFGIEVSQSEGERARPSPAGGAVIELPVRAGG